MDDKNSSSLQLKSTKLINDTTTQIFVLPPELLKELDVQNNKNIKDINKENFNKKPELNHSSRKSRRQSCRFNEPCSLVTLPEPEKKELNNDNFNDSSLNLNAQNFGNHDKNNSKYLSTDPENMSTINLPQSNSPKKRRGRPPKSKMPEFNTDISKTEKNFNIQSNDLKSKIEDLKSCSKNDLKKFDQGHEVTKDLDENHLPKRRRGRSSNLNVISENDNNTTCKDSLDHSKLNGNTKDPIPSCKTSEHFVNQDLVQKNRRRRRSKSKISESSLTITKCHEEIVSNLVDQSDSEMNIPKFILSNEKNSRNSDLVNSQENHSEQNDLQKKRRGRPPKSDIINASTSAEKFDSSNIENKNLENHVLQFKTLEKNDSTNSVSKRTRKRLNLSDASLNSVDLLQDSKLTNVKKEILHDGSDKESDDPSDEDIIGRKRRKYSFQTRGRGRQRGRPKRGQEILRKDIDYIPHHSQLSQSCKIKKKIVQSNAKNINHQVDKKATCGKCQQEVLRNQWSRHNLLQHNDLGWLEGSEKPNYEEDEKLLKQVLFAAIKRRRGNLVCETCNSVKRSVLGYLSHVRFCGKDESEIQALMVTCPVCNAVIKPASLEYHEKIHKSQTGEIGNINVVIVENEEMGSKIKRRAAEKASVKISEFSEFIKDEKNNIPVKKLKLNSSPLKKIIQKPILKKKIHGLILKKWEKQINENSSAFCSQITCQFSSKSLDEMKEHYFKCNFTPQENFVCKICRFQTLSEDDILNHALENHYNGEDNEDESSNSLSDTESSYSEDSDKLFMENEISRNAVGKFIPKGSTEISNRMFKFLFKNDFRQTEFNTMFLKAFIWTLDFEKRNYNLNLFEDYSPNDFQLLSAEQAKHYMPELEESMLIKSKKADSSKNNILETEWKKWLRFEGECIQDNPTFFTGGPIWAIAWLPIPALLSFCEKISQYIAVSTHPTMEKEYSVGKAYTGKNIIQIWNLGNLKHANQEIQDPQLAYAITHEGGTVWCLEWCPSGCYEHEKVPGFKKENNEFKRMGLLAAACSDGYVRIYSLPHPENLRNSTKLTNNSQEEKTYPIYYTEPSLTLVTNLQMNDREHDSVQVTKLCWSKEYGHNIIAAGYSTGYVALWNLSTKSSLLQVKRRNTTFLLPYRHFHAHNHAVTMIYLIPQDKKRFLVTASLDRNYKLWDLEDASNPKSTFKKSFITDGAWLNNWCCALISTDDALNMNHNYSYCIPLREYTYKYNNVLPMNSASYSIATSDYGNSIASGTLAGEVLAIFPHQLLYRLNMEKMLHQKRSYSLVSSVEVVDLEETKTQNIRNSKKSKKNKSDKVEYTYMPSTYKDSKNRFGLQFCDEFSYRKKEWLNPKQKLKKRTLTCEQLQEVPMEQYPFASVNRISWNPNASSFLWLAVGYQNGFVRLIPFTALSLPTTWDYLLTRHIDQIKSRLSELSTTNEI